MVEKDSNASGITISINGLNHLTKIKIFNLNAKKMTIKNKSKT